jgi:hypothetical protein
MKKAGNKTQGDRRREEARKEALAEIYRELSACARPGFFGKIRLEPSLQDGVVTTIAVTHEEVIKLPRLRAA